MKENLYLLILTIIITLALVSIYTGKLLFKRTVVFKIQRIYLLFIIFHCIYIAIVKNESNYFLKFGSPFMLFYGPLFYSNLSALVHSDKFRTVEKIPHFLIGFTFFCLFLICLAVDEISNVVILGYYIAFYLVACVQLVFYAIIIYIKFNEVAKDRKMIGFMNQSILIMIVSALTFAGLVFHDNSQGFNYYNDILEYIYMVLIVIVVFRFNLLILLRKIQFYKSYSKEEFFDMNKKVQITDEKYFRSKLSEEVIQEGIELLEEVLENEIYLQADLSLEILAKKLKMPAYHLSQVFNTGLDSNFNKVINSYRIQYAVELLNNPDNTSTIEEIGIYSGFNSRSSFYRAFKIAFDMTPSEYKRRKQTVGL